MNKSVKLILFFNKQPVVVALIMLSGLVFALLKFKDIDINQTLWAEDGKIFINQARALGIPAFWTPYAGYFHLYPRLVAWISSFFDLQFTPLIFLLGWFFAYFSLIFIVVTRALQYEISPIWAGVLTILILAQPHSGEVFFNMTNAQSFTGGGLSICLLVPNKNRPSIFEKGFLLIASFTGPFALLLTPLLLIQLIIYRDWNERRYAYLLVGLSAIIQLVTLLSSDRFAYGSFDKDIAHWMIAFFIFVSFGSTTVFTKATAMAFWTTIVYCLTCYLKNYDTRTKVAMLSLLIGSVLFWIGGLLTFKGNPHLMNPITYSGSRYFFVPYLLIFFMSGIAVLKPPILKYVVYGSLIVLVVSSFSVVHREKNLNFSGYVEFLKVKSDVTIPITPTWGGERIWDIKLADNTSLTNKNAVMPISVNPVEATLVNAIRRTENSFEATSSAPQMIFSVEGRCSHSSYIGLEVNVNHHPDKDHVGDSVRLFWSEDGNFSDQQSTYSYYAQKDAVVQLVFPRKNIKFIRFDPIRYLGSFSVNKMDWYCLGE